MKKLMLLLVSLAWGTTSSAQEHHTNETVERLKESNFYFLNQILKNKTVSDQLKKNKVLAEWTASQREALAQHENLKEIQEASQVVAPYLFSTETINLIVQAFDLSQGQTAIQTLIQEMKLSGKYANYATLTDKAFLEQVLRLNLEGLNHTLAVYGKGSDPYYPNIDAVSYDVNSNYYQRTLLYWSSHLMKNDKVNPLFFERSLNYALYLMYANHRDEGVRYEPLDEKYNATAQAYAQEVNFKEYPYNTLIVLGDGPTNYRDPLSALGKLNLEIAVAQYKQKKAPFIIVSGGHVHPNRTATCEAIVMKDELMRIYGIPEKAIIVEPYARHTTTNLRNATRLMLRYGFDLTQKSMIVSHYNHIRMIHDDKFKKRFIQELGYLPGEFIEIEQGELLEYYPVKVMTHINPLEPLDP
ncbi:YdcF family protein [Myroides fluvii]|uniref:YdcF family protein n=1 Tax=Myroides fluvii TaxID=2572594 RepID=UPI00131CB04F|nr:YdcF family protein [Myroides fluvii]